MSELMTGAVLTAFGDLDVLEVRDDLPIPRPEAGYALVKVTAAAVNNTDIWTRQGAYGLPGQPEARAGWRGPIDFPRIQGGDIAGEIVEVNDYDTALRIGQRVLVDPTIYQGQGPHSPPVGLLGSEEDGGFAQYVCVRADQCHDMTDSPLSDDELACLPVAYGTAMGMLERVDLTADEMVLVTGASGGVGLALVQLAASRGAEVIALTSRNKASRVRKASAHHILVRDDGDVSAQLQAITPQLDVVADIAGGPLLEQLLPRLVDNGRWVIAGAVAGMTTTLDLRRLYLHNRRLIGSSMYTRTHFSLLAELAREGKIHPRIAGSYQLSEIHKAQRQFMKHEHVGKITISP